MHQKRLKNIRNSDQPKLNRNTTLESLLVLGKRFRTIHYLILHILDLIQLAYIGKLLSERE